MKRVVIDTNVYADTLSDKKEVVEYLEASDFILMPIFVIAELKYGFKVGSKTQENVKILKHFLSKAFTRVMHNTEETALIFADLKKDLRSRGKPIPIHDVWIAAQTFEHGGVLATKDKHFSHVPGLRLWHLQ